MFVKLQIDSNLPLGTVVSFDSTNNYWTTAANDSGLIGVIGRSPVQDEDSQIWSAAVYFAGTVNAIADRAIADEGGNLCVINGRVYVDNAESGCGIIAPNARGQEQRQANELVMVHLK